MKNKYGFTMVELLATVTILGIISLMAIGGYLRYQYQAEERATEVLLNSAATAAEEFIMDNPGASVKTKIQTDPCIPVFTGVALVTTAKRQKQIQVFNNR